MSIPPAQDNSQCLTEDPAPPLGPPAPCVCLSAPAEYHCHVCDEVKCGACIAVSHAEFPLHQIQRWTGSYFEPGSHLKALGVCVQLGHGEGGDCPSPSAQEDYRIITSSALHEVTVVFCNCAEAAPHDHQLIEADFFPVPAIGPRVALTIDAAGRLITPE
ncbi:hypothetical protein B0H13DRAFT_2379972 [Mycena leptocephala]|nr:hypothetical protein B0H13DRAFT_2383921 [Mycena leptocephala]KAJ7817063.1 hypothetical protein B0H13DRAFT_2379972 [Mycena leptocephala]